jgi:hypothetical protein
MVRKTRKTQDTGLSVPELRMALDQIENYIHSHKTGDIVPGFRKKWKKLFGSNVGSAPAKEYIDLVRKGGMKVQKGGAQIMSPSSLNYEMVAGSGTVNVPNYVSGGFGFANMDTTGLRLDNKASVPAELGNNMVGGGRRKRNRTRKQKGGSLSSAFSQLFSRPFTVSSPVTALPAAELIAQGNNTLASPRPEINSLQFQRSPAVFNASINPGARLM